MSSPAGLAWVAARSSWSRRSQTMTASLVLAAASGLLVFLTLASAAMPQVLDRQADRKFATTPLIEYDGDVRPGELLTFEPAVTPTERWNGREIHRRYYAAGTGDLAIPGISRVPQPNEYFASPALQRLIEHDATARALFSALTPVGPIRSSGLIQPHELRAIVGIPREGALLLPVVAFGSPQGLGPHEDRSVLNRSVAFMTSAMIWLPAGALVFVVTRLRAGQRRRRFASLRNLGLSIRGARAVHALEAALVVLPGGVVACALFNVAIRHLTSIPGTPFGFYTADARPSVAVQVLAVAGVSLLLTAAAAFSHRDERRSSTRKLSLVRVESIGTGILVGGVAYLLAMPVIGPALGVVGVLGMWVSSAVVAVGLAAAGPRIVTKVCRCLAKRTQAAGTLVGARMGESLATTTTRLGSVACVVIVVMLGAMSFMAILNGGSYDQWSASLASHKKVPIVITDITGRLNRAAIEGTNVAKGLAQVQNTRLVRKNGDKAPAIDVVYASCDDLRQLTGVALEDCSAATPHWINGPADVVRGSRYHIERPGEGPIRLPSATQTIKVSGFPTQLTGALLLSPELAPEAQGTANSLFFALADGDRLVQSLARMSSLVPAVQFDLGELGRSNPDFRRFPAQMEWLTVGALASLLIALIAIAASLLGEAPERAARMRGLRILGAPRRELARAHLWATILPIATLGIAASLVGWVVCQGIRAFDDRATVPISAVGWSILGSVTAAIVIGLFTLPDTFRPTRQSAAVQA